MTEALATSPTDTPRASPLEGIGRAVLSSLWVVVLPALGACAALRYLVPAPAEVSGSFLAPLARLGDEHGLVLGVGLFAIFSLLGRAWRQRLLGGHLIIPNSAVLAPRQRYASVIAVVALAALAAVVFRSVVGSYEVSSTSMLPLLGPRDLIVASKVAYGFRVPGTGRVLAARPAKRGDVIVFRNPTGEGPERLVKRVIGLPLDRIEMEGNRPIINGFRVPYCDAGRYLFGRQGATVHARLVVEFLEDRAYLALYGVNPPNFPNAYDVKDGELFVLGDSRTNSADSRAWNDGEGGGLPIGAIEGRAVRHLATAYGDQRRDFARTLEALGLSVTLDGLDVRPLEQGIEKCLRQRPSETWPPAPSRPSAEHSGSEEVEETRHGT